MSEVFPAEGVDSQLEEEMQARAAVDLAEMLAPQFPPSLPEGDRISFCKALLGQLSADEEEVLFRELRKTMSAFDQAGFRGFQRQIAEVMPLLIERARVMARSAVPAFNNAVRRAMTERFPATLGVVCLTREGNQPLMWAHYADSHRGLMFEFDESHACFNRHRSADDDFGFLRPVVYSARRPELRLSDDDEGDRAFEIFALTKAEAWSYEQEVRLIWALHAADRKVPTADGEICLLACPLAAIRSITLGCKAAEATQTTIQDLLNRQEAAHIRLRRARMHETAFELVYDELPRP
jgi:hypothetical protein